MTIPPSEPDQSPQPVPFTGCGVVLACMLLWASFFGLIYLSIAVAPYRVHCNDGEGTSRHGMWDVHSAESLLREETKEGKRCQREYPQQ